VSVGLLHNVRPKLTGYSRYSVVIPNFGRDGPLATYVQAIDSLKDILSLFVFSKCPELNLWSFLGLVRLEEAD
jgi:hypothetical protein